MSRVNRNDCARDPRQRGVVAVLSCVLMVVLLGFAALTVDVGLMYSTRADMQRTADSAALAAAAMLAEYESGDPISLAEEAAKAFTESNEVLNRSMSLDTGMDIEFGRATFNVGTNSYEFVPTQVLPDAVRIRVRHTEDSPNGAVPLYFAGIFGKHHTSMAAEAIAVMVPRDIAIVADLSGSHNDDSELRNYEDVDINLFDVWDSIPVNRGVNGVGNGIDPPPPGDPDNPADPPLSGPGYAGNGGNDPGTAPEGGQRGPTFGRMYWWGDSIDGDYDPATDPGLIDLPRYQDWNDADLVNAYQDIGYSADEISALMSSDYDGSKDSQGQYAWTNRVAIALGLARWNSGMPGGLWESIGMHPDDAGNGNGWMGSTEVTWLVDYPYPSGSWSDYIYNYVRKSSTAMAKANSDFQYEFGLKTYFNYLLERKYKHSQTPDLADTPHQPMKAVKDAVNYMVEFIDDLDTDDQLSLEIYGTEARHEVDLTHEHVQVAERINEMQAGHYDQWTNLGGGIEVAIEELTGERARAASIKMVILLTDGKANVTADGDTGDYFMGGQYALEQAGVAAEQGIRIFAVSVGAGADQDLMKQIAEIGQGEHFHAEGTIEQYSEQLAEIFRRLGGSRPVELIQ